MKLTYEIINNGKGYMIKNNGVNWIKQETFIPYPGETVEQAAQNHINAILEEQQHQENKVTEIEQLKVQNDELTLATLDLAETVARQDAQLQEQSEALLDLANTLAEVINNG